MLRKLNTMMLAVTLLCLGQPAMAAYTINVTEVGGNVVASGSGSINTAALTLSSALTRPLIKSVDALLYIGGTANMITPMLLTEGELAGPTSFGTGLASTYANNVSGGLIGIIGPTSGLFVPQGYVSESPMTSSATWNGATLASLGLTPGTYTWTWGTGATADSFTVQISPPPAAIPTLSQVGLIALGLMMALLAQGRLRRSLNA